MTDWTPEEERVANWFADHWWDGCEVKSSGGRIAACTGPCACREAARDVLAISAMQPRWRDVKTDPPPLGAKVITARAGENGTNMCALLAGDEWVEVGSGRTTITHHSFAPPTHWQFPPLPTAPEDKP